VLLGRSRADIVQLPKGERGLGDFPKSVVQVQDRKIFPWHEVHGGLSKKLALQNNGARRMIWRSATIASNAPE